MKYNNTAKEKEDFLNEMTKIVHEKDVVIGQLQKTNGELKQYVTGLEKLNDVQPKYKGKSLSAKQNKTRTFLTRAEIALWFSKFWSERMTQVLSTPYK